MAEYTIDSSELVRWLAQMKSMETNLVAGRSLYRFGQAIMTESKRSWVPVDSGVLRGSGHVTLPRFSGRGRGGVEVTLGFGGAASAYALATHENPRAGHTKGRSPSGQQYKSWATTGQYQYLRRPVLKMAPQLGTRMARDMRNYVTQKGRG